MPQETYDGTGFNYHYHRGEELETLRIMFKRRVERPRNVTTICYLCEAPGHTQLTCPLQHCAKCSTYGHHVSLCSHSASKSPRVSSRDVQARLDEDGSTGSVVFSDEGGASAAVSLTPLALLRARIALSLKR